METATGPFRERLLALGQRYSDMMGEASIQRCNCMVRYGGGDQMPAIRRGKAFLSPEGDLLGTPSSHEDMHFNEIKRLMAGRNEAYIGHIFGPYRSAPAPQDAVADASIVGDT